jgi:DNA-binding CsgD family transcriptional regulator
VNAAPTLSPTIFDLYDSASKGQAYLLETLCRLFNCQATSIQEYPCHEDPFLTDSTFRQEPTLSFSHQQGIYQYEEVSALAFKSNHSVNCYLLIHSSTKNNQTLSFTPETEAINDHVIEALNISYKITQQENDLNSIHYVLDHYPIPAVAIDEGLNTVFANQSALRILQKATKSTNTQVNLFKLCKTESRQKLKQAIINSLMGNATTSRHMIIDYDKASLPLIITTTNTVPNVFRHFSRNTISWIYILKPAFTDTLKSHPEFQALGLSTAEIQLSCALFSGQSLNNIAEQRHVSKQTVRKQLQSILRKTGCESQENLILFFFENYIHYGLNN